MRRAKSRTVRVSILPRAEAFQIPDLIRTKINLLPPDIQQVRVVEIVGIMLAGMRRIENERQCHHCQECSARFAQRIVEETQPIHAL